MKRRAQQSAPVSPVVHQAAGRVRRGAAAGPAAAGRSGIGTSSVMRPTSSRRCRECCTRWRTSQLLLSVHEHARSSHPSPSSEPYPRRGSRPPPRWGESPTARRVTPRVRPRVARPRGERPGRRVHDRRGAAGDHGERDDQDAQERGVGAEAAARPPQTPPSIRSVRLRCSVKCVVGRGGAAAWRCRVGGGAGGDGAGGDVGVLFHVVEPAAAQPRRHRDLPDPTRIHPGPPCRAQGRAPRPPPPGPRRAARRPAGASTSTSARASTAPARRGAGRRTPPRRAGGPGRPAARRRSRRAPRRVSARRAGPRPGRVADVGGTGRSNAARRRCQARSRSTRSGRCAPVRRVPRRPGPATAGRCGPRRSRGQQVAPAAHGDQADRVHRAPLRGLVPRRVVDAQPVSGEHRAPDLGQMRRAPPVAGGATASRSPGRRATARPRRPPCPGPSGSASTTLRIAEASAGPRPNASRAAPRPATVAGRAPRRGSVR